MDIKILEQIGLTSGEIKVYLALLKLGSNSTGPISHEAQVSRSKIYMILDKLEKKGLVSHVEKSGTTYFQAAEPAKIEDYINEKQSSLKKLKESFEDFLPQLEKYQQQAGKVQTVKFYQGMNGLITAHEHTYLKLKKGEEYHYLGIPKYQPETQHMYWQRDHLRRIKAGIKTKILFNKDALKSTLTNRNSYKGCEARYMPEGIKTPAYFLIYADTVMIAMPVENPIAIEIISEEIAQAFEAYFQEFWKRSKPFKA